MKNKMMMAVASMCVIFAGNANASTRLTTLGAIAGGQSGIVENSMAFSRSFQDSIESSVAGSVSIGELTLPVAKVSTNWTDSSDARSPREVAIAPGKSTFADLAPGIHAATISGAAAYRGRNSPVWHASAAAVPQVENWLIVLIGLGLAAYQLHRKQKALGDQVISDEALSSA